MPTTQAAAPRNENQGVNVGDAIPAKFRNIPPPLPANNDEEAAATETTEDEAKFVASEVLDFVYNSARGEPERAPAQTAPAGEEEKKEEEPAPRQGMVFSTDDPIPDQRQGLVLSTDDPVPAA